VQALKHPYFEGFTLNPLNSIALTDNASNKNFFNNPANDFQKPGSKARIESRKGVLSRKSSINKNSFYRSKGVGKVPDYLPNKPNVVGSRGQPAAPYNIRERKSRAGLNSGSGSGGYDAANLPALQSSGGVSANAYNNASSGGVKGLPSGSGGTKGASGKF
jgi:hypothetical protein